MVEKLTYRHIQKHKKKACISPILDIIVTMLTYVLYGFFKNLFIFY